MRVDAYEDNRDDDMFISIDFDDPFIQGEAHGICGTYPVRVLRVRSDVKVYSERVKIQQGCKEPLKCSGETETSPLLYRYQESGGGVWKSGEGGMPG